MKKDKKMLKSASIITGALLTGSLASFAAAENSSNLLDYNSMGSGAEVRTEIMDMNAPDILSNESTYKFGELKCGEGKCGEGEEKTEKKAEAKKTKKAEAKTSEAKCGEAKCGEGEKKAEKKTETKKEGKATEAKCGEGKCG